MLRPGHVITLCALALLTLGVVMVNSALMSVAPVDGNGDQIAGITPESIILSKSTLYLGLAVAALATAALLPVRRLSALVSGPIERDASSLAGLRVLILCVLALLCLLSLVYFPIIGKSVNGSARWVRLGGSLSIQPSEIAKWGLIALIAWYGAVRSRWVSRFRIGLLPALAAIGVVCFAIVLEDLGTGVLIAASSCVVLLAAGARMTHFACFIPLGAVGIVAAIATSPYRVKRILAFLDPFADPQGTGYHMIQSMAAIAGGGGAGRGLGHGFQKFGYLPEDHTDFLFAIVCEELGIAGGALVLALYIMMLWAAMGIVRRESDRLLKLLGLGIITTIGLQAVINLFVVTGMAPTKGIALPLMSSGGTGWILTAGCLGLLAAMDRTQPETEEAGEDDVRQAEPAPQPALREPKPLIRVRPVQRPVASP